MPHHHPLKTAVHPIASSMHVWTYHPSLSVAITVTEQHCIVIVILATVEWW